MMWLKSCPRCGGDLYSEQDIFGVSLKCLQCGHILTEAERQRLPRRAKSVSWGRSIVPDASQGGRQAA